VKDQCLELDQLWGPGLSGLEIRFINQTSAFTLIINAGTFLQGSWFVKSDEILTICNVNVIVQIS